MMNFRSQYNRYYDLIERELALRCAGMDFEPVVLKESMRYSLLSGGKRVRPVLFLSAVDMLGGDCAKELPIAVALECIHTYSLIHDDLPAMDNDDFRRGNPSNHKKFGEANAILAGDALLSYAFDLLLFECGRDEKHLKASRFISKAAGAAGMIAGQSADLLFSGKNGGEKELSFIYQHKTGDLIKAPLAAGALICGRAFEEMSAYGEALGRLFQLTDDILDVEGDSGRMGKTLGKDSEENKLTCVKIYGLERARTIADECAAQCINAVKGLNLPFFEAFAGFVRNREN